MKAFRDSYDQTYESLATLGERYEGLPAGWKFRVAELDRDLVLAPTKAGGTATIMQDEFENTFDYLGRRHVRTHPSAVMLSTGHKEGQWIVKLHAKLPKDDDGAKMHALRGRPRPAVHRDLPDRRPRDHPHLIGGVYNTIGLNTPTEPAIPAPRRCSTRWMSMP